MADQAPLPAFMTPADDESFFNKHARFVAEEVIKSGSSLRPAQLLPLFFRLYTVGCCDGAGSQVEG